MVVRYGRPLTATLLTPVAPPTPCTLQPPNLCPVSRSRANPGVGVFLVTLSVKDADLHVTPFLLPGELNVTVVPFCRPAFRAAPRLTAVPPAFPVVRTAEAL